MPRRCIRTIAIAHLHPVGNGRPGSNLPPCFSRDDIRQLDNRILRSLLVDN